MMTGMWHCSPFVPGLMRMMMPLLARPAGDDLNMLGGLAGLAAAVLTDVEGAHGLAREVGDFSSRRRRYR